MATTTCFHDVCRFGDTGTFSLLAVVSGLDRPQSKHRKVWGARIQQDNHLLEVQVDSQVDPPELFMFQAKLTVPHRFPVEISEATVEKLIEELSACPFYAVLSQAKQDELHAWVRKIPAHLKACLQLTPNTSKIIEAS